MRDGWRRVPLGDVAQLDIDRVPVVAGRVYSTAGVLNEGKGLFAREPLTSADTSYAHLHRLRAGQLVMRKLTAFEGSLGIVPSDLAGSFVSTEFPTFTVNSAELLPGYLALVCQQPWFWHEMWLRSTGTVQRRKRVNPGALLSIEFDLPPLHAQERIVDLTTNLDSQVATAAALANASSALAETFIAEIDRRFPPSTLLDSCLDRIDAGRSPSAEDRLRVPGEAAVLKVSAVARRRFVSSEVKVLTDPGAAEDRALVRSGDTLVTRANGLLSRVGQACFVRNAPPQTYLSDKTLRLVPNQRVTSRFLSIALLTPQCRRQIESLTGGSDMRNISQSSLKKVQIALPSRREQQEIVSLVDAIEAVEAGARAVVEHSGAVRNQLLNDLLSGSHEIPEAYDALLGEVA